MQTVTVGKLTAVPSTTVVDRWWVFSETTTIPMAIGWIDQISSVFALTEIKDGRAYYVENAFTLTHALQLFERYT